MLYLHQLQYNNNYTTIVTTCVDYLL